MMNLTVAWDSFPFEEAKLPEDHGDDHHEEQASHDGRHHDPDGDTL